MRTFICVLTFMAAVCCWAEAPDPIFSADFDESLNPAVGTGQANVENGAASFTDGVRGQAYVADGASLLSYPAEGNLDKSSGTLCMWVKPMWDGDDGKNHALFADDLNFHDKPQNCLYLWKWSMGSLRFDMRTENDRYFTQDVTDWKSGQWRHIAVSWNHTSGTRVFVDGTQLGSRPFEWEPKSGSKFYIGANFIGGEPANALIDEVRIFDWELDAGQVQRVADGREISRAEFASLSAPRAVRAGEPFDVRFQVRADALSEADIATEIDGLALPAPESIDIARRDGALVVSVSGITIPSHYRLQPGKHTLRTVVNGAMVVNPEAAQVAVTIEESRSAAGGTRFEIRDASVCMNGDPFLAPGEGVAFWFDGGIHPYDEAGQALCRDLVASGRIVDVLPCRLVDEVDCAQTDHDFCEWAPSRLITLADGRDYRIPGLKADVTEERNVYGTMRKVLPAFQYRLACAAKPVAHLVVVDSLNDQERYIETAIDAAPGSTPSEVLKQAGIGATDLVNLNTTYTGREYALDGKPFEQISVIFPKTDAITVTISDSGRTRDKDEKSGAAVRRIRVYEVTADPAHLSPETPEQSQRTVGLFYPHLSPLYQNYGFSDGSDATRAASIDCLIDYLQYMGFDRLEFHPYYFDRSAGFKSDLFTQRGTNDVFDDVLPIAERKGIKIVPRVDSLVFYTSGKGAEEFEQNPEVYQLTKDGKTMETFGTVPDPLHPKVQELLYDILGEMARKTKDSPACPAVGFRANGKFGNLYVGVRAAFPPEESGYSEFDVALFEQDTGKAAGGEKGNPASRYEWIKANVWDEWIEWRCRKIHEHWLKCRDVVKSVAPDKDLVIYTKIPSNNPGQKRDWENDPIDLRLLHRYHGYDPALYTGDDLLLSRVIGIDQDRYQYSYWNKEYFFQPEIPGFFESARPSGVELYYVYWELPDHPRGFRVGPASPVGRAFYEPMTFAMRTQNPGSFTFYNWFRATMGHENDLREFCRAFRGLPMTDPEPFAGRIEPASAAGDERLWVRQFGDCIAVVNDSAEAKTVTIELPEAMVGSGWKDLAMNERCEVKDGRVTLRIRAWDLRTLAPVQAP